MKKKTIIKLNSLGIISIFLMANIASIAGLCAIPSISHFTPDKTQADVNEPIIFEFGTNNIDFTTISSFTIAFHDGTQPITLSPDKISVSHSFQYEGKYLITLTALSTAGLTDQMTCEVEIVNLQPEILSIDIPSYAYEDTAVNISVGEVIESPVDEDNLVYIWNFGDGNYKNGRSILYTWSEAGIYPITLSAIDDQGALGTKTEFIEVINVVPVANFSIEPLKSDCPYIININENETIVLEACPLYFNASFSYDTISDINNIQYYWDFGDGQVDWGISTVHQFIQSGIYNVTLKVKDDNGDIGIVQKTVEVVNEQPWVDLLTESIYLNEGETFNFIINSLDSLPDFPLLNYSWSFGGNGWHPSNTWTDDFNGNVSVTVKDPEGLYDMDFANVVVENVNPHINLNWAYIDMNITMGISGPTPKMSNFSMEFIENNETLGVYVVSRPAGNHSITTPPLPFFMDISKDYLIKINRTHELEPGTYFVNLTFSTIDGNNFTIGTSFNEHWPGWKIDPNEWIVNVSNHLFDLPITFEGSIFDPSIDDIHLEADFKIHLLLEIDFPNSEDFTGPYRTKMTLPHDINHILYDAYIYRENGKIYSDLTFTENLINMTYFENKFPANIIFTPTFYPIDLSFLEMHENIGIDGAFVIDVIEAVNILEVNVLDDDGGEDLKAVEIETTKGIPEIDNLGPDVYIYTYNSTSEDSIVPMLADVMDFDNDTVSIVWDFGDGSPKLIDPLNGYGVSHVYENEGIYLITVTASDGKMITKTGRVIQILNSVPEVEVVNLNPNNYEDFLNELAGTYTYDDSVSDKDSLRFYWDFGDGSTYYDLEYNSFWCNSCSNSIFGHKYAESGFYNLSLYIIDDNGDIGYFTTTMNITNFAPILEGPFGFEGVEGRVINLDVAAFDSIKDECNLNYTWDIEGQILNGAKPSIYLDDGNYTISLTISDLDGGVTCTNLSLIGCMIYPIVSVSSKMVYGPPGEIEVSAYTMDTFLDSDILLYKWNFNNKTNIQTYSTITSTVSYNYEESSTLTVVVEVFDDAGKRGIAKSNLIIILDSDGDGLTDETEEQLGSSPESSDSDSDGIIDWYEYNVYGTDPLNPDTDGDGLPDGYGMTPNGLAGELWLGTDPLLADTDADNLTDGFEYFGWMMTTPYFNQTTGLETNRTYWVNSDPLLLDTDGDRLSDWEEYTHGTDPRNTDTDNDGINDLEDLFPNRVDSDNDGLPDPKELEIGTDPQKSDTDDDGLSDSEEYYPGEDGFITNPLNNDTDGDFLLDGQEMYSTIKNTNKRKKINAGWNVFSLYFDNGKRAVSALVTISISVGEGAQTTDLTIELQLRGTPLFTYFYKDQRYLVNITDVKDLVENNGKSYGGEWKLRVHSTIDCLLEEYTLDITKYLNPTEEDTDGDGIKDGVEINPELNKGWVTNPGKKDSDGDTINDNLEISRGWNPLSKDTDGDGVEDWRDADPLHNLIVMIKVKEGHYDSWEQLLTPLLQVTLEVEADPEHKWEVATPTSMASKTSKDINAWIPWLCESCWDVCWVLYWLECQWEQECTNTWLGKICWWELQCEWRSRRICSEICVWLPCLKEITVNTIQTTAVFNDQYYFDVDDGDTNLKIKGELWKNYIIGWLPHVSGEVNYQLMKSNYTMNALYNKKIYNGNNWISLDIVTKGVSRVNTIAVHEEGNFYNGHYSSIERMNVVILNVISGYNSKFDSGINVILIPTSIFTDTKLHSIIETSVDETGTVSDSNWNSLPSCLKGAKVAGIDRNNYKDTISPNVECVISKNVSAQDAFDILLLAVTSANESEGIIFSYTRNYRAEELGIAADVMELIPLDMGPFQNSETGEWPRTPWENFIQVIKDVIQFVIDVLIAIGNFFVALFEWIAEIGMNLVENVTKAALAAVEAIIKAIILVLIYLMVAIFIITSFLILVTFLVAGLVISAFTGTLPDVGWLYVGFEIFDIYFKYSLEIKWVYSSLLDLDVPVAESKLTLNEYIFFNYVEPIATAVTTESQFLSPINNNSGLSTSNLISESISPILPDEDVHSSQPENAPELKENSVSPIKGWTTESYTYQVEYYSPTNSSPSEGPFLDIFGPVDHPNITMEKDDPTDFNYIDGCTYKAEVELPVAGSYQYKFSVIDENGLGDITPLYDEPSTYDGTKIAVGFNYGVAISTVTNALLLGLTVTGTKNLKWSILLIAGSFAFALVAIVTGLTTFNSILADPYPHHFNFGLGLALLISGALLIFFAILKCSTKNAGEAAGVSMVAALLDFFLGLFADISGTEVGAETVNVLVWVIGGVGLIVMMLSAWATAAVLIGSGTAFGRGIPDSRTPALVAFVLIVALYVILGGYLVFENPGFHGLLADFP